MSRVVSRSVERHIGIAALVELSGATCALQRLAGRPVRRDVVLAFRVGTITFISYPKPPSTLIPVQVSAVVALAESPAGETPSGAWEVPEGRGE